MDDVKDLIEAEIPRLRRYAYALLRNPINADDLVQETLVRALAKAHLWQKGTNLRAWLFTMLHHLHVNTVRKAARIGEVIPIEDAVNLGREPSQTTVIELNELKRAMMRLPEEQRAALLLIGLEGMHYGEVAAIVEVPVGTVRSRLSRARAALREMLDAGDRKPGFRRSLSNRERTVRLAANG
jgi:RNA polymerase sigma-70 factor (ECF subfamily)